MSLEICSADFKDEATTTGRSDRELLEYFRTQMAALAGRFERMTWRQRQNRESLQLMEAMGGHPEHKEFCKKHHQGVFPPHRQLEAVNILLTQPNISNREFRNKLTDPPSTATVIVWRRRFDAEFPGLGCLAAGSTRLYNADGNIRWY